MYTLAHLYPAKADFLLKNYEETFHSIKKDGNDIGKGLKFVNIEKLKHGNKLSTNVFEPTEDREEVQTLFSFSVLSYTINNDKASLRYTQIPEELLLYENF